MNYRKNKLYKRLNTFEACSIVENFFGENHKEADILTAWQYLLDTGTVWKLQGWYGRSAVELVSQGLIEAPIDDQVDSYGNEVVFNK